MKHPETHFVTEENGPAAAGRADECFYCKRKLGEEHAEGCACRERTVVVEVKFRLVERVPEHWTEDNILFFYNEGTHCGSNEVEAIVKLAKEKGCVCCFSEVAYLREATEKDEEVGYGVKGP